MLYRLQTTEEIDSAHFLRGYNGKCANLHGHRWKIDFTIETHYLNEQGFVIDFTELKKLVREMDHTCLNEHSPFDKINPTAENISAYLAMRVKKLVPKSKVGVRVFETPNNSIEALL